MQTSRDQSGSDLDETRTRDEIPPRGRPEVFVEIGALTHPGCRRANNEDQFLVARLSKSMRILDTSLPRDDSLRLADEAGYLMLVADGMGGAAAGEQASELAIESVECFALNTLKWFLSMNCDERGPLIDELRRAIDRADREVIKRADRDPALAGMGTTLTVGYSLGSDLFIVHAGDCRAYLLRAGAFKQITHDHTLAQLLVDAGSLTPEAAKTDRRRNVVTNVIGGPRPGVHTEIHKVSLADNDVLLLCSDGLTEAVDDLRIAQILESNADSKTAARLLIDEAIHGGGPDNVTVVVARYHIVG